MEFTKENRLKMKDKMDKLTLEYKLQVLKGMDYTEKQKEREEYFKDYSAFLLEYNYRMTKELEKAEREKESLGFWEQLKRSFFK